MSNKENKRLAEIEGCLCTQPRGFAREIKWLISRTRALEADHDRLAAKCDAYKQAWESLLSVATCSWGEPNTEIFAAIIRRAAEIKLNLEDALGAVEPGRPAGVAVHR